MCLRVDLLSAEDVQERVKKQSGIAKIKARIDTSKVHAWSHSLCADRALSRDDDHAC